jgi:ribonucleoside-triphosphate reductase
MENTLPKKSPMVRLRRDQIDNKIRFIDDYVNAKTAADGSQVDPNANVTSKNLATLSAELHKDINIQINRQMVCNEIEKLYGIELADEYVRQIENHEIYVHDESSLLPYCVSISMYPFLLDGLTKLGGESKAPKHLASFCGNFVNLVFAISSQFAGAVATVEFLMMFDYFARLDFGDDYLNTHRDIIDNELQHVVYALNQPAAARGYQSVFWNISIFDKFFFNSLFESFVYPDLTPPNFETVNKLQTHFMKWFNAERAKPNSILTFPVVTAAMLTKNKDVADEVFADVCCTELAQGNSFFIYQSDSVDSLSSCCRLRNELVDNTFSYTLGAGGVSTGSINVITINMNRLIQDKRDLKTEVQKVHKYHHAYRQIMQKYKDAGMLSVYDAGFISLDKQFMTIGINGMLEGAESLGLPCKIKDENGNTMINPAYMKFVDEQLTILYNANKEAKKTLNIMFNSEFVPAENLGVKNAKWDKKAGYIVPRDCYNSYFFPVEDDELNIADKFILHGKDMIKNLDGGSALHLNLEEYPTKEGYRKILKMMAQTGCNYLCTNVKITICNDCGNIDKHTLKGCPKCHSSNIDYATRIIGYLKRVSAFGKARGKEASKRMYHKV